MAQTTPQQWILQILKNELSISNDHIVDLAGDYKIGNDKDIYIACSLLSNKALSFERKYSDTTPSDLFETITIHNLSQLSIHLFSKSTDAIFRKNEVQIALLSNYSRQLQDTLGFGCEFLAQSETYIKEDIANQFLHRFVWTVNVFYSNSITKQIDFYDNFSDTEYLINQ